MKVYRQGYHLSATSNDSYETMHVLLIKILYQFLPPEINITFRGRCDIHFTEVRSIFCLALYTEEVNLQTFTMFLCKTICCNYAQEVSF